MHLKSVSMKGFKSFPNRTRLLFSPGVSVIVGPNGCGKSNITDAVLWALGEQSPLAVRGQSMQDVIFAGGKGQGQRRSAEVEVVIDNSEGRAETEFSEISITRRLDRSGEGEYRLNGARCRLSDVIEVLSDTNLGREMHSVISQGRVEAIIHSKPRDRRLLIEEAAGLGKHRKRRRRAQLKLDRTRENVDRALDVEREARSRVRPLKRQAQAADLRARLERDGLELRARLVADELRSEGALLAEAESRAESARKARDLLEAELTEVNRRREGAEERISARDSERRELSDALLAARSARDRLELRAATLAAAERELAGGLERRRARLRELEGLESELRNLVDSLRGGGEGELAALASQAEVAAERRSELEAAIEPAREAHAAAEQALAQCEERHREAAEAHAEARRLRSQLAGELEAAQARLAAASTGGEGPTLAAGLKTGAGYELALSAALGDGLGAEVVDSLAEGRRRIEAAEGAARALVREGGHEPGTGPPPTPDAKPLLDLVEAGEEVRGLAARLLRDAWLVDDLGLVPADFIGVAVTRDGRCLDGRRGELRRIPAGATDPALLVASRRDELAAQLAEREGTERRSAAELDSALELLGVARRDAERAEDALRDAIRGAQQAAEEADRLEWLLGQRETRQQGPQALRRAQLERELAWRERLATRIGAEEELLPQLTRLGAALGTAQAAIGTRLEGLEQRAAEDERAGVQATAELRNCAREEYELQERMKRAAESVTEAEVSAAHLRDRHGALGSELDRIAAGLDRELEPASEALGDEEREEIERKLQRLERRREQVGPVNPLAQREYEEALEHVGELEAQREDLEEAMAELEGLIKETDRRMRIAFEETLEATAKNFEELVEHLFPGGRGRLRLVTMPGPRKVIGGGGEGGSNGGRAAAEKSPWANGGGSGADPAAPASGSRRITGRPSGSLAEEAAGIDAEHAGGNDEDLEDDEGHSGEQGVEIEVTPAGKAMRRLSLLSGGEKSLVAIAFVFAVFLARPSPFYILDEVEAALDDANIDRFLQLVRRSADRAQFIIVTHQKRTMDAADILYGVSMGEDGVTKVVSRRLPRDEDEAGAQVAEAA